MFGIMKLEIWAAIIAVAALIIGGTVWRLHWLSAEVDRAREAAAASHADWQAEHTVREALVQAREADAALVTQHAQEADALRRQLAARKHTTQEVYNASPTARAWRDTPIPPDLLAGLRAHSGRDPARDRSPDAADRADNTR